MAVRSFGVAGLVFALSLGLSVGACTQDSRSGDQKTASQRAALNGVSVTQRIAWGEGQGELGFRPSIHESLPMGAPAVAVGQGGQVFVLDALHERVVRATKGDVVPVAKVPRDADDLAIGSDGAIAVLRQTKPEVLVFTPSGEKVGSVDVSAVEQIDAVSLGTSRRVMVTSSFQETFLVGSPAMPQLAGAVLASKREGAAFEDASRAAGVVTVRRPDGELELRVIKAGEERSEIVASHALGKGEAARVIGASKGVACVRVEHVTQGADSKLSVEREAACLDVKSGATVLRTKLPAPGAYVLRRELAFAGSTLAFARADGDGLQITTWTVEASR